MADAPSRADAEEVEHRGTCHCRAVRFTVMTPREVIVEDCNCSICRKAGYLHLLVPATRFKLDAGADALETYTFNTGVAKHTFCRYCGVKPFYVPRSNPDGYSINLRCVDRTNLDSVTIEAFDGTHWEHHAQRLKERTKC